MKKSILAISIAMLSTAAFAGGYGGLPSTSSVAANVSGGVSIASGGNGGSAMITSGTTAGTFTVSGAKAGTAEYCDNGVTGAVSGSAALGYTKSYAAGQVTGNAVGSNMAQSSFAANTNAGQSTGDNGLGSSARTGAAVNGGSAAGVNGTGMAVAGGITAAGTLAGGTGSIGHEYDHDSYLTGIGWGYVKGHTRKTETETAEVKLGSISGSGSLAGSYSTGAADAAAGVQSSTRGGASVDAASRNDNAIVEATVNSGASSMAESDWGGNGLAGSGAYAGAAGEMSAYNTRVNEYDWKAGYNWSYRYNESTMEYSNVTGSDVKVAGAGKFEIGNGNADMAAGAGIELDGTAGDGANQD